MSSVCRGAYPSADGLRYNALSHAFLWIESKGELLPLDMPLSSRTSNLYHLVLQGAMRHAYMDMAQKASTQVLTQLRLSKQKLFDEKQLPLYHPDQRRGSPVGVVFGSVIGAGGDGAGVIRGGCSPGIHALIHEMMENAMLTIDQVLDQAMQLPYEDKQAVVDILRKRIFEEERDRIAQAAKDAQASYASGKVTRGSALDLQASLDADDE